MAEQSAKNAVVSVLAPICVDNFQHATAAKTTLAELKATESVETRIRLSRRAAGQRFLAWKEPNNNVAEACAKMLNVLK